jgi:hypothetical protein
MKVTTNDPRLLRVEKECEGYSREELLDRIACLEYTRDTLSVEIKSSIEKCLKICKTIQDREWTEDMQHVRNTYATGYADGAGDVAREIRKAFIPEKEN